VRKTVGFVIMIAIIAGIMMYIQAICNYLIVETFQIIFLILKKK